MAAPRPLNWNATLVLQALTQGHGYGYEIMNATLLPSGTVYPILRRLEAGDRVRSTWEDEGDAHAEGRPARRIYVATASGRAALADARARMVAQQQLFGDLATGERGGG